MLKAQNELRLTNNFPDCVFIKLHTPYCERDENRPDLADFDLGLTIRFGEEQIGVLGGSISFGLKRGELKLKLVNAKMPIEKHGLTAPLEIEVSSEIQNENGNESELSILSSPTAKIKGTGKRTTKTITKAYSVSTRGTEEEPVWIFEAITHEGILKGQANKELLGLVCILARTCSIKASFEIHGQRDIHLTGARGLWPENIGRNKLAIIEREIFLRYISPKLEPCLSFTEIEYEQNGR